MEPLPDINKVFSLIQNHEKQRGIGILPLPTVDSTALFSRMDNAVVPYSRLPSVYTGSQLPISYNGSQLSNGSNPIKILVKLLHSMFLITQHYTVASLHPLQLSILEWIIDCSHNMARRTSPSTPIVVLKDTLWTNVINSMVTHLDSKAKVELLSVQIKLVVLSFMAVLKKPRT